MITLYDYLKKNSLDEIDITDRNYDVEVAFVLPEQTDDNCDKYLISLAQELEVISGNQEWVIVDLSKYVQNHYDILENIFDYQASDSDDEFEYYIDVVMPGLISGEVSENVYSAIMKDINTTPIDSEYNENEDDEEEFESLEDMEESKLTEAKRTYFNKLDYDEDTFESLVEIENRATLEDMKKIADEVFLEEITTQKEFWNFLLQEKPTQIQKIQRKYFPADNKEESKLIESNEDTIKYTTNLKNAKPFRSMNSADKWMDKNYNQVGTTHKYDKYSIQRDEYDSDVWIVTFYDNDITKEGLCYLSKEN